MASRLLEACRRRQRQQQRRRRRALVHEYRRRLGIGDPPVEMVGFRHWQPPKRGEIKINFSVSMPEPGRRSRGRRVIKKWGGISAEHVIPPAISSPSRSARSPTAWARAWRARQAAGNLAKKLWDLGEHDGPVISESGHVMVTCGLHEICEGEPEAVMEASMPEDLEDVSMFCNVVYGDRLRTLPRDFLREIEQDKVNAGFSKTQTKFEVKGPIKSSMKKLNKQVMGIGGTTAYGTTERERQSSSQN